MTDDPTDHTLRDRAHWESLSDRELDRSIKSVRGIVAEHQAQVDDAQRFLEALIAIRVERRHAAHQEITHAT